MQAGGPLAETAPPMLAAAPRSSLRADARLRRYDPEPVADACGDNAMLGPPVLNTLLDGLRLAGGLHHG
ncbi:MAG: hypothetical protein R3D80_13315 [Paracoccaceae bacterium]